jgi:energy-coupling factor transporter ATP-binding protein EcfA2
MENLQERIDNLYLNTNPSRLQSKHKLPIEYVPHTILNEVIQNDLEIPSLYSSIFGTTSLIDSWASIYTTDTTFLKQTQKCIRRYSVADYKCDLFRDTYDTFINETNFIDKYQYIGFKFLKQFNESAPFLHSLSLYNLASPILSLLSPLMMLLLPFMIIKLQNIPITISAYIDHLRKLFTHTSLYQLCFNTKGLSLQNRISAVFSLFIYGLQVYQNTVSCISFYRNITKVYQFLIHYREHLRQSIRMMDDMSRSLHYSSYSLFKKELLTQSDLARNLLDQFNSMTDCDSIYMKIGQIGILMRLYYELFMNSSHDETIQYTFFIHAFNRDMRSLKRAVKEKRIRHCSYGTETKMKGMYYLPHEESKITNEVDLEKNIMISGPNASGKTTLLKGLCLNAIMSQQFGYGCYEKATVHCYDIFHSYLNIPDTSGRDSLFQAEARRCKEILDSITNSPEKRHLCIFDEIYSGTNPNDAVSCAKLYLRGLNRYKKKVDYLITTHYIELCELFKENKEISNKKMKVNEYPDHLEYSYKMVEGISYIHGGLYILKQLDYPASLYETT